MSAETNAAVPFLQRLGLNTGDNVCVIQEKFETAVASTPHTTRATRRRFHIDTEPNEMYLARVRLFQAMSAGDATNVTQEARGLQKERAKWLKALRAATAAATRRARAASGDGDAPEEEPPAESAFSSALRYIGFAK